MVASSFIVALLLVAPSLAVPVAFPSEPLDARDGASFEEVNDLATRDPKFRLGGFLKKAVHTVGKVAKVAAPIAANFIREDSETEFSARDFEGLDLSERELAYLEELAVRDPSFFSKIKRIAGKVAHYAAPAARIAAGVLLRREDGFEDILEFSERDLEELEDLAVREPKFRLGGFLKKVSRTVGRVAKVAGPIASNFIREEGEDVLSLRDLEEFIELAERDPKFNLGRVFRKVKGVVGRVKNTLSKVAKVAVPVASKFIREEGEEAYSAREDAEIDDLLAREYDLAMLD